MLKNTDKNNKIGHAPQLLTEDIGQGKIDGFGKTSTEGKCDSIDSYKHINFYTFIFRIQEQLYYGLSEEVLVQRKHREKFN